MNPLICLTMGDPAGIGPEISVAAAVSPEVLETARVVVVGHEAILKKAASAMHLAPRFIRVNHDCQGAEPGAVNVMHLDNLDPASVVPGQVQARCGQAAYEYVAKAVSLAQSGLVAAICTAPINKEALDAAKIPHLGHTEILGHLTGTPDPVTMFQVNGLRIFFLTRHMPLIQACREIRRDKVAGSIRCCLQALESLGLAKPRLAVAALNPHAGEHGLFGDEEVGQIEPAVAEAAAEGLMVFGPKPADSVFHQALNGSFDAVLALYHDQGHIAAKMVDFEGTVALTLGLPFLRTSVDHGTAFDIAGLGLASPVSLISALRLGAAYAPLFARKSALS